MKKTLLIISVSSFILLTISNAYAIIFQPNPTTLEDLPHNRYYGWKINWSVPAGETITGATLTLNYIDNWVGEPYLDHLYIHLLDDTDITGGTFINSNAYSETYRYYDYDNGINNWAGKGIMIDDWTDPLEGFATTEVYTLDSAQLDALNNYAADGKFGLGFDPDCHYYNRGIQLEVKTCVIPEPASLSLLGLGLLGLAGLRKKKSK